MDNILKIILVLGLLVCILLATLAFTGGLINMFEGMAICWLSIMIGLVLGKDGFI